MSPVVNVSGPLPHITVIEMADRPNMNQLTRELVIGSLPYVIPYRVRDGDIEILRVLHTSRRWPSDA